MGKHRHFVGNDRLIHCGGINMYSAKKEQVPISSSNPKESISCAAYTLLLLRAGPVCAGSSREHRQTFVNPSPLRQRSAPNQLQRSTRGKHAQYAVIVSLLVVTL